MTLPNDAALQKIQFYTTTPYPCGYLEGRQARSLIAAPHHLIDADAYNALIQLGFRRSGKFTYRPQCQHCNACVPIRIPVANYVASRSQKRARKRHSNLTATVLPLTYSDEHFALYRAYQSSRHGASDDAQQIARQYRDFLVQGNVNSRLMEFRLAGQLKIVSVVDILDHGLSAVYTFYDTSDHTCSYGTYSIVWLIEWVQRRQLQYLYLGYWIAESAKMAYKQKFQPQEGLINGRWQPL